MAFCRPNNFMASLGRKGVVALRQEGVDVPTDILGIVYIPLDEGGAWKTLLARELAAAGFDLDPRKLKAASRARRSATSRNA